jgi:UPF0176 protein
MGRKLYNKVNGRELKEWIKHDDIDRITLSFYKYHHLKDPHTFRDEFYLNLDDLKALGRIYISYEGINGQMSVPKNNLEALISYFDSTGFLKGIRLNYAIEDDGKSFFKLAIKVREKILADGLNDHTFDVTNKGVHLNAKEFNEITDRDDTVVIDMRNHYESEVGHFENAIKPDVVTFRESLPIIADMLDEHRDKNIVMYCTGGIRCEKASAYFKHKGYEKVFQLNGGIIEYARQVAKEELKNKFIGKNFVFDERMGECISSDVIANCHQCGEPCDTHVNCANDACHILFIQCENCSEMHAGCCSDECSDFIKLPPEVQKEERKTRAFNGTKFGKARFPHK